MQSLVVSCLVVLATVGGPPLVVGHRGNGADRPRNPYPENSLPAIAAGFAEGADLVEIDVQLTADNHLVLWHDEHVRVDPARRVRVRDVQYAELPWRREPEGFAAHVPTLDEALVVCLQCAEGRRVLDIELKVYDDDAREPLAEAVLERVLAFDAVSRVLVTSMDREVLAYLERRLPALETGWIAGTPSIDWPRFIRWRRQCGARVDWFVARHGRLPLGSTSQRLIREAHQNGVRIGLWTVNDPLAVRRLAAAGCDLLITDEVASTRAAVGMGQAVPFPSITAPWSVGSEPAALDEVPYDVVEPRPDPRSGVGGGS